jgi:hypothetical protein
MLKRDDDMCASSTHLTPERLKIIGETAPAVVEKVIDGTIPRQLNSAQ